MNFKEYRQKIKPEVKQLDEELTPNEKAKADRMRESGRDYYLEDFHSSHPEAQKVFQEQRGDKPFSARIPIELTESSGAPHTKVTDFLSSKGHVVPHEMYRKGLIPVHTRVGNPEQGIPYREKVVDTRISKVLEQHNAPEDVVKAYTNDPFRKGAKSTQYDAILTAHHHDIVGASTGRGWLSCANIRKGVGEKFDGNGPAAKKMEGEVNNMTHHIYLVPRGGNVDTDAVARASYKLHTGVSTNHKTLIPDNKVYGDAPADFLPKANEIVGKLFHKHDDEIYKKHDDVYSDNGKPFHIPAIVKPEAVDAAFKTVSKDKDEFKKARVIGLVNPDHKYKSTILNTAAKSFRGIREAGNSGNFPLVAKSVYDAHYDAPEKTHYHFAYDNPHTKDIIHNAVTSTFDYKNPDHVSALTYLSGRYNEGLKKTALDSARQTIPNAKNYDDYKSIKNFKDSTGIRLTDRQYVVPIDSKHEMGRKPLDHIVENLSKDGMLDHNSFIEAYHSTRHIDKRKENLYDHAIRLQGEGIPSMDKVVNGLAENFDKNNRPNDKALTYHYMKPITRKLFADAVGEDHKEVMKKYPTLINQAKEREREAREVMKKYAENGGSE